MKELTDVINSHFRTERELEFHFRRDSFWWDDELHILVTERPASNNNSDEDKYPMFFKKFYCIIRLEYFVDRFFYDIYDLVTGNRGLEQLTEEIDEFAEDHKLLFGAERYIECIDDFKRFLKELSPPDVKDVLLDITEGFDIINKCTIVANIRLFNLLNRRRKSAKKHENVEKPAFEYLSEEEHRKLEESTLSVKEFASYLGSTEKDVKKIIKLQGFPIKMVGRSKRISLGEFNRWMRENNDLFDTCLMDS